MNICRPGACICDAAEWPGDTNCMGEVQGVIEPGLDLVNWNPRYYLDKKLGVVFSIQADEMESGIQYFMDPELKKSV